MTVYEFTVTGTRRDGDMLDVDATVRCSSGTYIRALARDLGAALGTGGHLTRLRRTRVGGYRIEDARTLEQLAGRFEVLPLAQAAAAAFPSRALTADEAHRLAHGGRLGPSGAHEPTAAYAPDGTLIALVTEESGRPGRSSSSPEALGLLVQGQCGGTRQGGTGIVYRWYGLAEVPSDWGACVATIGVFDGVHRGHQRDRGAGPPRRAARRCRWW